MLFRLLKGYARLAIIIFCRKVVVNKPEWLQAAGPLLLACNHPNSFLDGIILTVLFERDVYTLARGDAFRNRRHNRILRWLRLLPVYRTSEGAENLEHNYTTFAACKELFERAGIVIIFSEGRCVNEWHLRPLKKGTARLAVAAWQSGIDLTVLPVGLNYNAFRNFGKNVFIHFGEPIKRTAVLQENTEGKTLLRFNRELGQGLRLLVYEIDPADTAELQSRVAVLQPLAKRLVLALPALAGTMIHAPLYFSAKALALRYFNNDHFDSTMVGMLALVYPVYVLCAAGAVAVVWGWVAGVLTAALMPFTAWAVVQLKEQLGS